MPKAETKSAKQASKITDSSRKKKKKKKNVSQAAPSSLLGAGDPAVFDESIESATEFLKHDETAFGVDLSAIPARQASSYQSYELYWQLPAAGLRSINRSHVVFENVSPHTLWVRAQRPMGYQDEPSAVAAWEPVGTSVVKEVRPFQKWRFTIPHTMTNVAVPRQVMLDGHPSLHVMSWLVFREPDADTGVPYSVDPKQTGFMLNVSVEFSSSDPSSGPLRTMRVLTFKGSKHLDHLDPPPSPVLGLTSTKTEGGAAVGLCLQYGPSARPSSSAKAIQVGLVTKANPVRRNGYMVDYGDVYWNSPDLDTDTVYSLDVDVAGMVYNHQKKPVKISRAYMVYVPRGGTGGFIQERWNLVAMGACTGSGRLCFVPVVPTPEGLYNYSFVDPGEPSNGGAYLAIGQVMFRPCLLASDALLDGGMAVTPGESHGGVAGRQNTRRHLQRSPPQDCQPLFKKGRPRPRLHLKVEVQGLADFFETVLEAVRVIVKIIKVATVVAGALGLLATAQTLTAGPSSEMQELEDGFEDLGCDG